MHPSDFIREALTGLRWLLLLLSLNGAAYMLYNQLSFMVLSRVATSTHAVPRGSVGRTRDPLRHHLVCISSACLLHLLCIYPPLGLDVSSVNLRVGSVHPLTRASCRARALLQTQLA